MLFIKDVFHITTDGLKVMGHSKKKNSANNILNLMSFQKKKKNSADTNVFMN